MKLLQKIFKIDNLYKKNKFFIFGIKKVMKWFQNL